MPLLFDLYETLLTDKQRETLEMYYNSDLSLGEISEETGITRQGVMNCIKKSELRLVEFEEKLELSRKISGMESDIKELENILSDLPMDNDRRIRIEETLNRIKTRI